MSSKPGMICVLAFLLFSVFVSAFGCSRTQTEGSGERAGVSQEESDSDELVKLQGKWEYTSTTGDPVIIHIKGEKVFGLNASDGKLTLMGILSINTKRKPNQFDLEKYEAKGEKSEEKPLLGLFNLEGEVLKLAFDFEKDKYIERPKKFTKENTWLFIKKG